MSRFFLPTIFSLAFSWSEAQVGWRDGPSPNIFQGNTIPTDYDAASKLPGPGDTSQLHMQGIIPSKNTDGHLFANYEGNSANSNDNNNNDQTNVNAVNNMNTAIQSNNNNVNVLDVILVGSPRGSHQPIG